MVVYCRLVSATQALLSSVAGALVCQYSCAISMLHGKYILLEAYAWFGAAYFIFDIWSMYTVHAAVTAQKIAEKLKIVSARNLGQASDTTKNGGSSTNHKLNGDNMKSTMYDKHSTDGTTPMTTTSNGCLESERQVFEFDGKEGISGLGFFKYMITHPIMMIHHIFIGTFGLVTITVRVFFFNIFILMRLWYQLNVSLHVSLIFSLNHTKNSLTLSLSLLICCMVVWLSDTFSD